MLQHGGFLHPTLDQPEVLDHLCRSGVSNEVQINGRERPADIFVDRWTTPDPAAVDVISTKSAGGAAQFKSSQVNPEVQSNPIQPCLLHEFSGHSLPGGVRRAGR